MLKAPKRGRRVEDDQVVLVVGNNVDDKASNMKGTLPRLLPNLRRESRDCVQGIAIGVAAVVVLDKGVEFAQGHVTPMLNLAQLLCHVGIHVTFLNTEHIHCRLTQRRALSTRFPTLRLESIPDGLPPDHPRTVPPIIDIISSLRLVTKLLPHGPLIVLL
ncbi:hypothetical protein C1H46_008807 [Malus baccata]|uniref:Uncharacterized protein n=1 Tax=Malus baccata TaxID=106549 RepID=A0A540N4Y4_MALBA|nr:hypothetical protein C1H46_008807 [Malus baccata]